MAEGPELVVKFAAELAAFESGINRVIARINELDAIVKRVSVNFSRMGGASGVTAGNINQLIAALEKNRAAMESNSAAAQKNTAALEKLNTTMANSKRPLDQSGKGIVGVTSNLRGLLAGYIGVHTAISSSKAFVQNAVEVGRYEKVLETASGSQAAFAKNTKFLESVADEFRLNVLNLGREFANLTVATRGTVLEGKETERIFRATAMAASALQMSGSQVTLTFKAFTDMVSKGVVSSEELKRQLGNHMPGAFAIAARAMGVTTAELQKMLDSGQLMTADLLPKLAVELEKSFGKGAQSGAESLGNNIEYAKGQLSLFFAEFGKTSGVTEGINNIAREIGDLSKRAKEALDGPLGKLLSALNLIANPISLGRKMATFSNPLSISRYFSDKSTEEYLSDPKVQQEKKRRDDLSKIRERISQGGETVKFDDKEDLEKAAEAAEKARQEAERRAAARAESQRKAWALEDAQARMKIQSDAWDKVIAEWNAKKERPGFTTTLGPAFTSGGLKQQETGFGGADKVLADFSEKIKSHDIEGQINIRLENDAAREVNAQINEIEAEMAEMSSRLNEIIKGFTADAAVSIGEALGTMMAGMDGADASKKIGQVFGDLISNLGKALIAFAAVKIAADASLKSMNPYVALAAGIAAVAAGTALKATANKQQKEAAQRFWTGGIVDGPGGIDRVPAMLTKGEMVLNDRQQSNLFRMMNGGHGMATTGMPGGGDFKIEVLMSGVLSGNDISISNERAVRSRKVHRGSLG